MPTDETEQTIITESGRCSWARCIFCSFSKKPDLPEPDFNRLKYQLDARLTKSCHTLKYLNSGSFLDKNQIPQDFQKYLIQKCIDTGIKQLIIESRPDHITTANLKLLKDANKNQKLKIYFALGLETSDNETLKKICKGFTTTDYQNAAALLKKQGFYTRTYLMANLPYTSNIQKSLDDSVNFAQKHSDTIAIINTYPYGYAPLFNLWLKKSWRPLDKSEFNALVKKHRANKKIDIYYDDYISYPRFKEQTPLIGATKENLNNPIYDLWQDYIVRFYEKPPVKKYALFLPCAYRKPYSFSKTHKQIIRHLKSLPFYANLHHLMISNPGIIPREFETKYPFAHYDWPEWEETPEIKKQYIKTTEKRIQNYLKTHRYEKLFAYFKPESETYTALKSACKKQNLPLISCLDKNTYKDFKDNPKTPLTERRLLDALTKTLRKNIDSVSTIE